MPLIYKNQPTNWRRRIELKRFIALQHIKRIHKPIKKKRNGSDMRSSNGQTILIWTGRFCTLGEGPSAAQETDVTRSRARTNDGLKHEDDHGRVHDEAEEQQSLDQISTVYIESEPEPGTIDPMG